MLSKEADLSFKEEFGEALAYDFPACYAISKENSQTTAEEFLEFCKKYDLPYEIVDPPDWMVDKNNKAPILSNRIFSEKLYPIIKSDKH